MAKRTYQQYCGLASALDVVGERWTLLIVRELLIRPRRYGELLNGLPGIGTNLLAERLKALTDLGLVEQTEPGGSGKRFAYCLTPTGERLRPIVLDLARWGLDFVGAPTPEDAVRPDWGFLAIEAMIDQSRVGPDEESYEFRVDDEVFHISVHSGRAEAGHGPAGSPAMVATTDAATFVEIGCGRLTPLTALVSNRMTLSGSPDAVTRCCDLIGLTTGAPSAAGATRGSAR